MTLFDYFIAAIVVIASLSGLMRGFTRSVIGMMGTVFGLLLAVWFYPYAAVFFEPYITSTILSSIFGFLTIFVLVVLAAAFAAWLVSKVVRVVGLSIPDRMLGGVLGAAQGCVFASILLLGILSIDSRLTEGMVQSSRLAPYAAGGASLMLDVAPRNIRDLLDHGHRRAKELWARRSAQS